MTFQRSSFLKPVTVLLFACVALLTTQPSGAEQLSNINGVHDPSRMVFDPVSNRWIVWWTGNGIPFATSPDKVTWTTSSSSAVFPVGNPLRANYWAPDMWDTPIHGKYYLFYSLSAFGDQRSSIKVASTPSLTNPTWTFVGDVSSATSAIFTTPSIQALLRCRDGPAVDNIRFLLDRHLHRRGRSANSEPSTQRFHPRGRRTLQRQPSEQSDRPAGQNAIEGPYIFSAMAGST